VASAKGANVYAFEPFEYVIEDYLSKTVTANPNIVICKYALSNREGTISFMQDVNLPTAGKISNIENSKNEIDNNVGSEAVTVQAITLDKFVQENNLPQVDFIKADIEGAERYMLMGAKQVLKEFAPKLAICTYHLPDDPKTLRKLILDANPNYVVEEKFLKMYAYVPK